MLGIIVRIFVSCPVPQLLSSLIMPVLQVYRNRHGPLVPDCVHGLKHSHAGRIALWRGCHIGHCLGQDDLGFRKSDPLHGLGRIHSHRQCLGICVSHILRCAYHNPSGNEFDILTRIEHPGQIIDSRIRVRAAHALDKCRNRIIMVIPVLIVPHHPFLDAFLGH